MRPSGSLRMLLLTLPAVCLFGMAPQSSAQDSDSEYVPLRLYQGDWIVEKSESKTGAPDRLRNDCSKIGEFFACQQTVNGKVSALIIFIPSDKPGHYFTQAVVPEGWAQARGELQIDGDRWTYLGKDESNGKTTYHRTTERVHRQRPDSL